MGYRTKILYSRVGRAGVVHANASSIDRRQSLIMLHGGTAAMDRAGPSPSLDSASSAPVTFTPGSAAGFRLNAQSEDLRSRPVPVEPFLLISSAQ